MPRTDPAESDAFDEAVRIFIGGFALGLLAAFVGAIPVGGAFLIAPIAAVFVAAVIVTGGLGLAGAAFGYAGATTLSGGLSIVPLVSLCGYVTTSVVAAVLWYGFGVTERSTVEPLLRRVVRGFGALSVGSIAGGVVSAWLYTVVGTRPFFVAPRLVAGLWLSLIVGVPVLAPLMRRLNLAQGAEEGDVVVPGEFSGAEVSLELVSIPLVWGVIGVLYSVGYRGLEVLTTQAPQALEPHGIEFLWLLYDDTMYGVGGRRTQSAFGGAMLVLLALATVRAMHDREQTENVAGTAHDTAGDGTKSAETERSMRTEPGAVERLDGSGHQAAELDRPESEEGADS